MLLALFHDIPDVAGTDAQAPGGGDRVLGGDDGIINRQQEITTARQARLATALDEGIQPLLDVSAEDQDHGRFGDEGLVVAGDGQSVLDVLVGDVQDGIELLIAGSRSRHGCQQDLLFDLRGDGLVLVRAHGFTTMQILNDGIQGIFLRYVKWIEYKRGTTVQKPILV